MNEKITNLFIVILFLLTSTISGVGYFNISKETTMENIYPLSFSLDCPDDFELFIYCGGYDTWSPTYMLYTDATGEAFYYNISYEDLFLENFYPVSNFNFTNDEMDEIWNIIISHNFFNLETHYEREPICDGSFANVTITGNGLIHSVQTENIDMDKLDNIVKLINGFSPDDCNLFYTALINHGPLKPSKPTGSLTGKIRNEYNYTSFGFDTEDDNIYFKFDWGDGTTSEWAGPYESSENVSLIHSWIKKGEYNVRVKSIDDPNGDGNLSDGNKSKWSDPLPVSMPKNKYVPKDILSDFFQKIFAQFPRMKSYMDFFDKNKLTPEFLSINDPPFDPDSGTRGELDEAKCEITITIDIKLYGEWVDKYSDQMGVWLTFIKNDIENKWNREKWDKNNDGQADGEKPWRVQCHDECNEKVPGCTVKFEAKVEFFKNATANHLPKGGKAQSEEGQGSHWIKIADPTNPAPVMYVNQWDGVLPTPNDGSETSGVWNLAVTIGVFAHEAGHLLGLQDQQDEVEENGPNGQTIKKKYPKRDFEDNIMGWPSGWPTQNDIDYIVGKSGVKCPCKCCPEENDTTPPQNQITYPHEQGHVMGIITVTGVASDDESGVAELDYLLEWDGGSYNGSEYPIIPPLEYVSYELGPIYLENYIQPGDWITITTYAIDAAGNVGQDSVTVTWEEDEDTIPPVTEKIIGEPNEDGGYVIWPHTPIWLNAVDEGGSGVDFIYYEIAWDMDEDGVYDQVFEETIYQESAEIHMHDYGIMNGLIELRWFAADNAGNVEDMHFQKHMIMS